jgi:proteasome lid subunit RPN8/RPN11/LysM repeat protein
MKTLVSVPSAVLDGIREHVNGEIEREVGGILVGTIADGHATVNASIAALSAVGHRANVTFTHEVWDDLLPKVDKEYPGQRIVGWYHSHPGFGIFLSEYDTFIHKNFFSDPAMLALVIDPHTGDAGWFGWRDDEVALLEEQAGTPSPRASSARGVARRDSSERSRSIRRSSGLTLLAASLASAAVAFALGYATAPAEIPEPAPLPDPVFAEGVTEELEAAQAEIVDLRTSLAEAESALADAAAAADNVPVETGPAGSEEAAATPPAILYTVRRGDTLWGLASSLYGAGEHADSIVRQNSGVDPDVLAIGQVLVLPTQGLRPVDDIEETG